MKAEIVNRSIWVACEEERKISSVVEAVLEASGFTILGMIDHYFHPIGYTKLWLLAESHCAMHTFPEETKTYIELSSCSVVKFNTFWQMLFLEDLDFEVV